MTLASAIQFENTASAKSNEGSEGVNGHLQNHSTEVQTLRDCIARLLNLEELLGGDSYKIIYSGNLG